MKWNIKIYIVVIWVIFFVIGFFNFVIKINIENCILVLFVEGFYFEFMVVLFLVILVLICSFVVINNWFLVRLMRNLVRSFNIFKKNYVCLEKKMIILIVKIIFVYLVIVVLVILWLFGLCVGGVKNCVLCNDV